MPGMVTSRHIIVCCSGWEGCAAPLPSDSGFESVARFEASLDTAAHFAQDHGFGQRTAETKAHRARHTRAAGRHVRVAIGGRRLAGAGRNASAAVFRLPVVGLGDGQITERTREVLRAHLAAEVGRAETGRGLRAAVVLAGRRGRRSQRNSQGQCGGSTQEHLVEFRHVKPSFVWAFARELRIFC